MSQECPIVLDEDEDEELFTVEKSVISIEDTPRTKTRSLSPHSDGVKDVDDSAMSRTLSDSENETSHSSSREDLSSPTRKTSVNTVADSPSTNALLSFDWRKGVKGDKSEIVQNCIQDHKKAKLVVTSPSENIPPCSQDAKSKPTKTKAKAKKGAKTEEEKLEIAVAMGKHRHLEVKAMSSPQFLTSSAGGSFEYYMIEHDRLNNVIRDLDTPDNMIYFRRHLLELNAEGTVVAVPDQYFVERVAIVIWSAMDLINDLRSLEGRKKRIKLIKNVKTFIERIRAKSLEAEPVKYVLIVEDCDSAIAKTKFSTRDFDDFLVHELEIGEEVSHVHAKTATDIGHLLYENFKSVEKWPYRTVERGTDFLDNVKRHKSFSASQDLAPGEMKTNRDIDGIQLLNVWTNQLKCIPRMGEQVAEGMAQLYPSFRTLTKALDEDPDETERRLQGARGEVRRELKLARVVRTLFLSDDPHLHIT